MDSKDLAEVRRTLWAAADQLRANSTLAPSEYRGVVGGAVLVDDRGLVFRAGGVEPDRSDTDEVDRSVVLDAIEADGPGRLR